MTTSTTANRISYSGNAVTVAFSFPYRFLANGDLTVLLVNDLTQVSVEQVLDTDYTVAGAGDDAGGTVTMTTAPPTGETLVMIRIMTITQLVDTSLVMPSLLRLTSKR